MTKQMRFLASASLLAVAALGASPAFAAGTASGSTITNTVTLSYQVGGVAQTDIPASVSFTVDRKINLTVAEVGTTTTSVSPGQTAAVTTFTVTNNSNATLDFALAVANQSGGTGPHGGTDNFEVTTPTVYADTNTNGVYDSGVDLAATYVDEVIADASRTVFVVAAIPLGRATNDVAAVVLTATALNGGTAGSQGSVVTDDAATANTNAVETVFADAAGATDALKDGKHSARDDYTVQAANLSVAKLSYVISDPFNNVTNPKMIPGAVVEYCVTVSNAAGSATATNVSISDTIPAATTYVSNSIMTGATVSGGTCSGGAAGGSFAAGVVSATIGSVAASATAAVRFRVTVN